MSRPIVWFGGVLCVLSLTSTVLMFVAPNLTLVGIAGFSSLIVGIIFLFLGNEIRSIETGNSGSESYYIAALLLFNGMFLSAIYVGAGDSAILPESVQAIMIIVGLIGTLGTVGALIRDGLQSVQDTSANQERSLDDLSLAYFSVFSILAGLIVFGFLLSIGSDGSTGQLSGVAVVAIGIAGWVGAIGALIRDVIRHSGDEDTVEGSESNTQSDQEDESEFNWVGEGTDDGEDGRPERMPEPTQKTNRSEAKSGSGYRLVNAVTVAALGIGAAVLVSSIMPIVIPVIPIGIGAIVAAGAFLVGRRSGKKRYAGAGASYTLGLAVLIYATSLFPAKFGESVGVSLLVLGSVSALIVIVTEGLSLVVQHFGGEYADKVYRAFAALAGLLGIVWAVLTAHEKAVRYGGISIGSSAGFVLNILGIELPIPMVLIEGNLNGSVVLYVGGILIGFHTLDTIHAGWRATKATASAGASVGKAGAAAAQAKISDDNE